MTNEEFIDRVLVKCRRSGDVNLRAVVPDELNEMIDSWEHASFMPWFLETFTDIGTGSNAEYVALPADYLLLIEDTKLRITDTAGAKHDLNRMYHEDLMDKYENATPTLPEVYDIFQGRVWLGPHSDQTYFIRFKYYQKSASILDDGTTLTNLWALNAKSLVVSSIAAKLVADYLKDMRVAGELQSEADRIRIELVKYNESRKHVDMDYTVDR
jgi:hypothetical protein